MIAEVFCFIDFTSSLTWRWIAGTGGVALMLFGLFRPQITQIYKDILCKPQVLPANEAPTPIVNYICPACHSMHSSWQAVIECLNQVLTLVLWDCNRKDCPVWCRHTSWKEAVVCMGRPENE